MTESSIGVKERAIVATLLHEFPGGPLPGTLQKLLRPAPESFEDLRFGTIAVAIRELSIEAKPVHVLTAREWLKAHNKLDDAGGALFDSLAADAVPLAIAEYESEDVWAAYATRRVQTVLADALSSAEQNPGQTQIIAEGVIETLGDLAGNGAPHSRAFTIRTPDEILGIKPAFG